MSHTKIYARWRTEKPKEAGYSHELISTDFDKIKDSTNQDELNVQIYPGVDTLLKAIQRRCNDPNMKNLPWFGAKGNGKYDWQSTAEVHDEAKMFASGCMALNLVPEVEAEDRKWRFFGIQAKNRTEWFKIHVANMYTGATTVALYDTLGVEATMYVLDQTEMTTVGCSKDIVHKIVTMKCEDDTGKLDKLKNLVCFEGDVDKEDLEKADKCGIKVFTYGEVLEQGKNNKNFEPYEPKPDDIPMFSYTSGTTGDPKGVKLSHKMLLMAASSVNLRMDKYALNASDRYISYLPAAHSFE